MRRRTSKAIAGFLFLGTCCTAWAETASPVLEKAASAATERGYWLRTERKGTGFTYEHIALRQLENGHLEYSSHQHVKMTVAGLNPQDMIIKRTYIVDAHSCTGGSLLRGCVVRRASVLEQE